MDEDLLLRRATKNDIQLLFEWANDTEVRANSLNRSEISFAEHESWFSKRLASQTAELFILIRQGSPAGVIRFEFNESEKAWIIGYSIDCKFRNFGLGKKILFLGLKKLNKYPVVGYIKPANFKSIKVFESLGFQNEGIHINGDLALLRYTKRAFDAHN